MFGWFKKRSEPTSGRDELFDRAHPVFKVVDAGFQLYVELVSANPSWEDNRIEEELRHRGVEAELAQELVSFIPMAFGRELVQQMGVKCSDNYVLHNLLDESERELSLATEMAFAWAKAMVADYWKAERKETIMLIAGRSAELNAINNALHAGTTKDGLRKCLLRPSLVYLRRAARPK